MTPGLNLYLAVIDEFQNFEVKLVNCQICKPHSIYMKLTPKFSSECVLIGNSNAGNHRFVCQQI
jgi:hypothetical protein